MVTPGRPLSTARLSLEPITDDDVAALVRHWGDEQVRRYLWDDQPVTLDMVNAVVTTSNHDFQTSGYGIWAIRSNTPDVAPGALIGMSGLRKLQGCDWTEMLFSLRPRYWHRGFATEAAHAVLRYGLESLGLSRVVAGFDRGNSRSVAVLKRLGMSHYTDEDPADKGRVFWSTTHQQFLAESQAQQVEPSAARN